MITSRRSIFIALFIFALYPCDGTIISPIVSTKTGAVIGKVLKSRLNRDFFAFRGIPYAEAPINEQRFKPPVPVKPWSGLFDATQDGPMCIQPGPLDRMSEDCLRLNIYTTDLQPVKKKSVIFFLHPGGFYSLSSQSNTTVGPEHFMDTNVILVSANYRLGIFGFLSIGTNDATGNYGLKDQVIALRWIQDNIESFGGDPNAVTIMGYSAGAMSVTLHLISPMSRGLFQRAIVMSGSSIAQWNIPTNQLDLAKKQARLLNCKDDSIEEIMHCLRTAKAEDFGRTLSSFFEFGRVNPIIVFKPVIEQDFGQERFLIDDPVCSMAAGQFEPVDILTGITQYEFLFPAIDILRNESWRNEMNSNFIKLAPVCFFYERNTTESELISLSLKNDFFPDQSADWINFDGLSNLFADGVTGFGIYRFAQMALNRSNVYHYRFSYTGRYSHTYYPSDKPYGAVHHDDLLYLFHVPLMTPMFTVNDPEDSMVKLMTGLWSNFANSGDPNIGDYTPQIYWKPMVADNNWYLDINEQQTMQKNLFKQRYHIWNHLFPIGNRCR